MTPDKPKPYTPDKQPTPPKPGELATWDSVATPWWAVALVFLAPLLLALLGLIEHFGFLAVISDCLKSS